MESGKRKYSRCDFSQIVTYCALPHNNNDISTGLLRDFSYSGLCIITHHPLQIGREVVVKSSLLSDSITAVVRWCKDIGNATYKVGLEFKQ